MRRNRFSTLAAAAVAISTGAALSDAAHAQPTPALVLNGTNITGVTGIAYNGTLYDASFVTGTCTSIFGGCNNTIFTFNTKTGALGISLALVGDFNFAILVEGGDALAGKVFNNNAAANIELATPYNYSDASVSSVLVDSYRPGPIPSATLHLSMVTLFPMPRMWSDPRYRS